MKTLNIKISNGGTSLVASIQEGGETLFSCDTSESSKGKVCAADSSDWAAFERNNRSFSFYFDLDESFIAYCPAGGRTVYFNTLDLTLPTLDQIIAGETLELNNLAEKEDE